MYSMDTDLIERIRDFIDTEAIPVVPELERNDTYPADLVARMAELGVFGLVAPKSDGGLDVNLHTLWRVVAELSRGWVTLGQLVNTQTMATHLIRYYGTEEQKREWLPKLARGEVRSALAMSEPHAGSDVQNIRTRADYKKASDSFVLSGRKKYIGSGERGGLIVVLAKTDPEADPRHRGMSLFLVPRVPGLVVEGHLGKLGYKGFDTVQLRFDDIELDSGSLLGGDPGKGFYQVLEASEVGRINVAARSIGLMESALEEATKFSLEREAFGQLISEHQAIQLLIAEMATDLAASKALLDVASAAKVGTARADLETSMAKLFATEAAVKVSLSAMRVHGGLGYTTEKIVERLYREAPQMVIAEGTSDIQRLIIARSLLAAQRNRTT